MAQEAAIPITTIREIARQIAQEEVAKFARSGFLRNASITGGAGLSIRDGGSLNVAGGGGVTVSGGGGVSVRDNGQIALYAADGTVQFWLGPTGPALPDGTPQQGWVVRRADGATVLDLMDIDVSDGVLRQALNWRDRDGNVVLADDTDSGQGMARPHLSGGFARTRFGDMTVSTTAAAFETLWHQRITKQQPRLEVSYLASMDTAGTTGETRVLVNGAVLGAANTETFAVATRYVGPAAVAGNHMDDLLVEIQGRRTSASGALRVEGIYWKGRQT